MTVTSPIASGSGVAEDAGDADASALSRANRAVLRTPDAIVVGLVALALASGVTVTLGQHRPWTTLPLAGVLAWGLWLGVRPRVRHDVGATGARLAGAADLLGARALLLGVGVWTVLNAIGAAEYFIVSRDPGFLTLSGLWLVDHPSTDIPTLGSIAAADAQPNLLADASQAWNLRGDMIQPQGAKMLPALLSTGGWVAGTQGVLIANVVVGAVGLLALYLVAKRFVGPVWAALPAGIVGLSVAHIGLSRSPYSEPLTLLLVIAALAWAWRGIEERRLGALVAAGAATGATALVRVDGAAFAAGALLAVVLTVALTARSADAEGHGWRVAAVASFLGTQVVLLSIGYLSLWRWSEAYLERLAPEARAVCLAYAATAVLSLIWAATWNRRMRGERLVTTFAAALGRRGAMVAGALVSAALVILASRPLWTTVHRGTESSVDQFTNGVVEYFQRAQGMEIDPTRTYAEHTVTWIAFYLTWPLVIAAFAGFGAATYLLIRHRPAWALLVVGCLAPTMLYLLKPEIVPDQIWAIRRFESAAIPAFAIAATLAAWLGVRWLAPRLRAPWRGRLPALVAGAMLALPVTAWVSIVPSANYPVSVAMHVFTTEMSGARAQIDGLCDAIDGRPVVLYGTSSHFGTVRTVCDVPVVLALDEPTPDTLRDMTAIWGEPPVVITRQPEDLVWTEDPAPVLESRVSQGEYRLQGVPRMVMISNYNWFAGVASQSGELIPLATQAEPIPAP